MANRTPVWDISQVEKIQESKNFNATTTNQKPTSSSKLHNLRNGQINVQTYYGIFSFLISLMNIYLYFLQFYKF